MSVKKAWEVNRYEAPPVILTPITDDLIGNDENLEPQFVRVRASNHAFVYLDANDSQNQSNSNNDFLFFTNMTSIKIKRIAVAEVSFFDITPNVNIRNNQLAFFRQSDGARFNIVIPEDYYQSGATFLADIVSALNASGSGIVFTATPVLSIYPLTFTVGGTAAFRWDETSTMITRGEFLINLLEPRSGPDVYSIVKFVGPMYMQYTRYVDVLSYSLNEYTKNPTSANNRHSNTSLLIRIYFDDFIAPVRRTIPVLTLSWFNFNRTRGIDSIDIKLIDEFGDPFYVPLVITNFDFTLILNTEI